MSLGLLEYARKIGSRKEIEDAIYFPVNLCRKYGTFIAKIAPHFYGSPNTYDYPEKKIDSKTWKSFVKKGIAEAYYLTEEEVLFLLKNKTPQKVIDSDLTCEWCKGTTYNLHDHHYPLKKSKGGLTTVKICPSCHYEFHFLIDHPKYKFTKEIVEAYQEAINEKEIILKQFDEGV